MVRTFHPSAVLPLVITRREATMGGKKKKGLCGIGTTAVLEHIP